MTQYTDVDFAILYQEKSKTSKRILTLVLGDAVEVIGYDSAAKWTEVKALTRGDGTAQGFVKGKLPVSNKGMLKFTMVDVQQGDGMVLETPEGKIVLIDGGDNKLFARHIAARFHYRHSSAENPIDVAAIIVTHGDADHFEGLSEIVASETLGSDFEDRKKVFIRPQRILHNGIVKGPSTLSETKALGKTVKIQDKHYIIDLFDDPRMSDSANAPFKSWFATLNHWETRGPLQCQRVAYGMNPAQVFDFLAEEGIQTDIQGPFEHQVPHPTVNNTTIPALPFFNTPEKSAIIHQEQGGSKKNSPSASHTINGHSIALRLTYGNVRLNLTGDLNKESLQVMQANIPAAQMECEILKAPHHGSSDFDLNALSVMRPVVALISSGDENATKEYIHPRATLMAALGHIMRGDTGIIFNTELAAFFTTRDYAHQREALANFFGKDPDRVFTGKDLKKMFSDHPKAGGPAFFYGFERTNFGLVHLRTDGERVLIFTHSGRENVNEAYRFDVKMVNGERVVTFQKEAKVI